MGKEYCKNKGFLESVIEQADPRFIILEGPHCSGKSSLAIALNLHTRARIMNRSWYLQSMDIAQELCTKDGALGYMYPNCKEIDKLVLSSMHRAIQMFQLQSLRECVANFPNSCTVVDRYHLSDFAYAVKRLGREFEEHELKDFFDEVEQPLLDAGINFLLVYCAERIPPLPKEGLSLSQSIIPTLIKKAYGWSKLDKVKLTAQDVKDYCGMKKAIKTV